MAPSTNGDLTESFFHLSSDQSDHVSSSDDLSVHTMDEFSAFLRLARAHDMKAQGSADRRVFSDSDTIKDADRTHRDGSQAVNARQTRQKVPENHISVFGNAPQTFHSTPLLAGRENGAKKHENSASRDDTRDNTELDRTFDGFSHRPQNDAPNHESGPHNLQEIDVEALFRAFKPFLDQYLQSKTPGNERIFSPSPATQNEAESDPESAIDDTFDRIKRPVPHMGRPELSSPVTSPPHSSRDSHFGFDKSTEVNDSDVCEQIIPPLIAGHKRDQKATPARTAPQLELANLTSDEISIDLHMPSDEELAEKRAAESKVESLESMRLKLDQYRKDNEGMLSELEYLRGKVDALTKAGLERRNNDSKTQEKGQASEVFVPASCENIRDENGSEKDAFEENLPQQFRPFYQRLQLSKVDELSESEKSNLIKNLMLSLLVSDFDHLSVMTPKVGAYLRISTVFLDFLHSKLYPDQDMKPSQYLRNYNIDINDGLKRCLDGMSKLIFED